MISFLLNTVYVVSRFAVDRILGPDVADECGGHDDSPESAYTDSVGTWRCGVCAMRLEG